jgi:hypothetical protein
LILWSTFQNFISHFYQEFTRREFTLSSHMCTHEWLTWREFQANNRVNSAKYRMFWNCVTIYFKHTLDRGVHVKFLLMQWTWVFIHAEHVDSGSKFNFMILICIISAFCFCCNVGGRKTHFVYQNQGMETNFNNII